ncbi:NUDIX domain-containing protein [Nocardioides sp. MAH-18]|uniref:NUDIX domain-containing protein n=1 Tax=Nocardioides agri TaxID=2682843 RepID=A0A6L6XK45_9ACTN|nr:MULTISPECIES: NUDIX hydrolase [unclassified Nocardioides]MBA2956409.1 NUDIX hydrolase [Nocardioides sp. CGMCC 1.13656]MVQ47559.1 NUDIX domain-containing protein [Nocardioides sp. MAH-18]
MTNPELTDSAEEWPVVRSEDRHRDDWVVALREDWIQRPDAPEEEPFSRLVLEHPGAVVVLAVDDEERVFCLWQYRHPAGRRFVELPAGLLDVDGEDPAVTAQRELVEEAGLDAESWTHLGTSYSSPGISSEIHQYYLARDLREVDRGDFVAHHEEADMQTGWVPYVELRAAALDGRLTDAHTMLAVLLAGDRGLVGTPDRRE